MAGPRTWQAETQARLELLEAQVRDLAHAVAELRKLVYRSMPLEEAHAAAGELHGERSTVKR